MSDSISEFKKCLVLGLVQGERHQLVLLKRIAKKLFENEGKPLPALDDKDGVISVVASFIPDDLQDSRVPDAVKDVADAVLKEHSMADVDLKDLLPFTPNGPTSINEFIKLHDIRIPPLVTDISLSFWLSLSIEERSKQFPDVWFRVESLPNFKDSARSARNQEALTELAKDNIVTLHQFGRAKNLSDVDLGVLETLNEQLRNVALKWLQPVVTAFKRRVDATDMREQSSANASNPPRSYFKHLRMKVLTYCHPYDNDLHMLGNERKATLEEVMKESFDGPDPKEYRPINYLIAGPRQGKSLMLQEVAARAAKWRKGCCGISITFNSSTTIEKEDIKSVTDVTCEFWGRVVHSMYEGMLPDAEVADFGSFKQLPFFRSLNFDVALTTAKQLQLTKVVIAADEMSKLTELMAKLGEEEARVAMSSITKLYVAKWSLLCSGFSWSDASSLDECQSSVSRRPIQTYMLNPVTKDTREDFYQMRTYLKNAYSQQQFTPAFRSLYEIVKHVPGYMGLWVELRSKYMRNKNATNARDVASIADLLPPFVRDLKYELTRNSMLFTDYWRAVANRQAGMPDVVREGVLEKLEKLGAVLLGETPSLVETLPIGSCYLSPLAFAHPALAHAREYKLIWSGLTLFKQTTEWTRGEKGKALEDIIQTMLLLTASHLNDKIALEIMTGHQTPFVSTKTLINRLGGQCHVTVPAEKQTIDETLPAVFPNYGRDEPLPSEATMVDAFPAVWSWDVTNDVKKWSGEMKSDPKHEQEKRMKENIAVLNSAGVSVIRPRCAFNPGCGVALLFSIDEKVPVNERTKILMLFESRYHNSDFDTQDTQGDISTKAFHALNGVLAYVTSCNVRRVCFVYCNTSVRQFNEDREKPFNLTLRVRNPTNHKTLDDVTKALATLGCTTSLHTVWNEEAWRNLLNCLYCVVPDTDEEPIASSKPIDCPTISHNSPRKTSVKSSTGVSSTSSLTPAESDADLTLDVAPLVTTAVKKEVVDIDVAALPSTTPVAVEDVPVLNKFDATTVETSKVPATASSLTKDMSSGSTSAAPQQQQHRSYIFCETGVRITRTGAFNFIMHRPTVDVNFLLDVNFDINPCDLPNPRPGRTAKHTKFSHVEMCKHIYNGRGQFMLSKDQLTLYLRMSTQTQGSEEAGKAKTRPEDITTWWKKVISSDNLQRAEEGKKRLHVADSMQQEEGNTQLLQQQTEKTTSYIRKKTGVHITKVSSSHIVFERPSTDVKFGVEVTNDEEDALRDITRNGKRKKDTTAETLPKATATTTTTKFKAIEFCGCELNCPGYFILSADNLTFSIRIGVDENDPKNKQTDSSRMRVARWWSKVVRSENLTHRNKEKASLTTTNAVTKWLPSLALENCSHVEATYQDVTNLSLERVDETKPWPFDLPIEAYADGAMVLDLPLQKVRFASPEWRVRVLRNSRNNRFVPGRQGYARITMNAVNGQVVPNVLTKATQKFLLKSKLLIFQTIRS